MTNPATFAAFEPAGGPGPREAWLARPYSQLLRGPTYRWWRAPLSLLVVFGAVVLAVLIGAGVQLALSSPGTAVVSDLVATPTGLLVNNLLLAAMIPAAMVAVWGGYGWRPRWVASVVPGLRWSWLLRCAVVSLAVVAAGLAIGIVLGGGWTGSPERQWPAYLAIVVLTTPLQAAGEEYLFRGWLSQAVGSLFASARAGALLAGGVSAVLFALAHGHQDPWLFADRLAFGAAASWLVWRTGGLEASIALHAANNLLALGLATLSGSVADSLQLSSAGPAVLVDIGQVLVVAAVVDRLARHAAVRRLFTPPIR
jgi:uncharacterized protein